MAGLPNLYQAGQNGEVNKQCEQSTAGDYQRLYNNYNVSHHHHYHHHMHHMMYYSPTHIQSQNGQAEHLQSKYNSEEEVFMINREKNASKPFRLTQNEQLFANEDYCINSPRQMGKNCSSPRRVYSPRPLLSNSNYSQSMNQINLNAMSPNHKLSLKKTNMDLINEFDSPFFNNNEL
jgi:hypothetical protein